MVCTITHAKKGIGTYHVPFEYSKHRGPSQEEHEQQRRDQSDADALNAAWRQASINVMAPNHNRGQSQSQAQHQSNNDYDEILQSDIDVDIDSSGNYPPTVDTDIEADIDNDIDIEKAPEPLPTVPYTTPRSLEPSASELPPQNRAGIYQIENEGQHRCVRTVFTRITRTRSVQYSTV
jgi:hypothetical protein